MRESDKLARITLAFEGVKCLVAEPETPVHRKALFRVPIGREQDISLLKAAKSSRWQKDYVDRLVTDGVLTRQREGSEESYLPRDLGLLRTIALEEDTLGGLRLAKYLFPSQVVDPSDTRSLDGLPEDDEPAGADEGHEDDGPPQNAEDAMRIVARYLANFELVAFAVKDSSEKVAGLSGEIQGLTSQVASLQERAGRPSDMENLKGIARRLDSAEKALSSSGQSLSSLQGKISSLDITGKLNGILAERDAELLKGLDGVWEKGTSELKATLAGFTRALEANTVQLARLVEQQGQSKEQKLSEAIDMMRNAMRNFEAGQALIVECVGDQDGQRGTRKAEDEVQGSADAQGRK